MARFDGLFMSRRRASGQIASIRWVQPWLTQFGAYIKVFAFGDCFARAPVLFLQPVNRWGVWWVTFFLFGSVFWDGVLK